MRGGPRPGAGRPPKFGEPSIAFSTRIPKSIIPQLDAEADRRGVTRSDMGAQLLLSALKALVKRRSARQRVPA